MKQKKLISILIVCLFVVIFIPTLSFASDPIDNPDFYEPGKIQEDDATIVTNKANNIIGAIVTIGTVISVVTLGILGIKYMIGSVEERAEYKKSMVPYLIGSVLLFATSVIVNIIANLIQNTELA